MEAKFKKDFGVFVRLMSFAKKYQKSFLIASFSTILLSVVSASVPYLMIITIDDFSVHKNHQSLLFYTGLLVLMLFFQVCLQYLFIYFANWVGQQIVKDIRIKAFEKIIHFNLKYHNNATVGKLVTRVVSDIETISNFFTQGVFMIISDLLKMLVVIFVMFFMDWRLSLISLSILPILLYATRLFQKAIKKTFQEVRNQVANLNSFVQERITGMKIVQLFNRENIEYQNFKEINNKFKQANINTIWYYSIFFPVAEILSSIAIGLLVWYGGIKSLESPVYQVGTIIGFIKMTQMLFRPLRQIADKFNQLQMGIVSGERVFKVIDEEATINDKGHLKERIKGVIEFKNVCFSYIENEPVLKNISFKIKQGESIAIIGATGSGKSTIINLLSRFYDVNSGQILVDSNKIEDYTLASLRNQMGVVLQDVFLFSDSILNNITLRDSSISLEKVIASAKEIGIHDFIMSLPNQYNYNVKERGAMLSSGQRQLISFLRAYVRNPSILILDEATSSVDAKSEQMIQYATEKITKNRTSIIVAHRLATIQNVDTILVMKDGKIVKKGNYQSLFG